MLSRLALAAALIATGGTAAAQGAPSALIVAPKDARATTVRGKGDGRADDGAAIQRAIDAAADQGGGGIVFLPAGTYRITRTLFLWPGVRLFGTGATRPRIVLGDRTPGFQRGLANMIVFAGARRSGEGVRSDDGRAATRAKVPFPVQGSVPFDPAIADANPGTFYSAISNVDIVIGAGNPAAAAIRFHAAQHAFVSHMDFDIGSGLAGLYQVGNIGQDLHFRGGRYGILTEKPSPAWPFALIDATFEGQREAAIREHEAGLTMVNVAIRDTPVGIDIDKGYGDWLFGKDVRFENVSRAGIVISNENNAYTQIAFENAVAANTPVFAHFRDSGRTSRGLAGAYRVASFNYGLAVPGLGRMGDYATVMKAQPLAALPARRAPALRALPAADSWFNVRDGGAKGDDRTDDTAAIQRAIDTHRTVYLPAGRYIVTDTLRLKPDSVLVALHPNLTQIILPDRTPGFQGVGAPRALVETAAGGDAIVAGVGLFTGGINPRATALLWKAGADSLVDDVKFQGGHGTDLAGGERFIPYNANATGDADPAKRWDAQYPSLWVTAGGGGTFNNIWTPNTYAQAGLYVSDTDTPGHVYQMSAEHHGRVEIALNRVANWELIAPQTEEEGGESRDAVALEIRDSRDILVANLHAYRVTRTAKAKPAAVTLYNASGIRFRNVHVNAESGLGTCDENGCATFLRANKFPYENAIVDMSRGGEVREREFATLDIPMGRAPDAPSPATLGTARVEKLADGFDAAGGGAVTPDGTLYLVDRTQQRIYRWAEAAGLGIERDTTLDPVNLAADAAGNLMVLSSAGRDGTVYSFRPGTPELALTVIPATPAVPHPGASTALPGNWWNNGEFRDQLDLGTYRFTTLAEMFARDVAVPRGLEYVSPDGSVVLPAYRTFQQGPADFRGRRFSDALDTYGFVQARPGTRVQVSNASEGKTYSALVGSGGALTDLKPFADRAGESVATDAKGRVFIANGQIFVHDAAGRALGRIDVPERPLQLLFGGKDGRTLFVITHHALYRVRP
ncbi:glycosyl hydrolase family 28-related protein [Sphingomonas sp. KR1UV-12]|uniref:Glycosyl hydrolase family 28-related protein n=1 Tax=Sphingomonas aurea TaxID=3063994 RepID=A0ABT9EK52_9SPHN|nr:glycosyl hydrolase family 28-related protein [Sphingomonas sp. KR1UV-12]MDP1027329.1 glycosyl hydrolase family 28-related protein [Sphingomonas sp. KR1UV-12]